jgi:hypothetical protein
MRTHNRTGRDRARTGNVNIAPDAMRSTTRPYGTKGKGASWTAISTEMLESPAYRALGLAEHRILARLQIELRRHAGQGNGDLIVNFAQFEEYGVRRHSIASGIRGLEALGFIEVTQRGRSGNSEFRLASRYRLTYLPDQHAGPTNKWRRIPTLEEAQAIAREARRDPSKEQNSSVRNGTGNGDETAPETRHFKVTKRHHCQGDETAPLSIVSGGWPGGWRRRDSVGNGQEATPGGAGAVNDLPPWPFLPRERP